VKKAVHYRATWWDQDWRILDVEPGEDPAELIREKDELGEDAKIEILEEVDLPQKESAES